VGIIDDRNAPVARHGPHRQVVAQPFAPAPFLRTDEQLDRKFALPFGTGNLKEIGVRPRFHLATGRALTAGRQRGFIAMDTQQGLRQPSRNLPLADAFGSQEKIGMRQTLAPCRPAKHLNLRAVTQKVLPDHFRAMVEGRCSAMRIAGSSPIGKICRMPGNFRIRPGSAMRQDGRRPDQLRPITFERSLTTAAPGSVLVRAGKTTVLCTASIDEAVPPWKMREDPPTGWVTAEYNMLPGSTAPRKSRERAGKVDGRSTEIQRLIGRSLRASIDVAALGPRTITVDCDVILADGGTRTLSITGGYVALVEAVHALVRQGVDPSRVLTGSVAAVSVGIVKGQPLLDLDYSEDRVADVDMNIVMMGDGRFVELQGAAEREPFSSDDLQKQLALAEQGLRELATLQRQALGQKWPLDKKF
jgi:ribonuclease PH